MTVKTLFKKIIHLTILNIEFLVGTYTWKFKLQTNGFVYMNQYQNYCLGEFYVWFYLMILQYFEYSVLDAFYVYLLKINDFSFSVLVEVLLKKQNIIWI